jgi:hypothetical protein
VYGACTATQTLRGSLDAKGHDRKEVVVTTSTEHWPHSGEHLQNDEPLARWTELLLALFAVLSAAAIMIGVQAM